MIHLKKLIIFLFDNDFYDYNFKIIIISMYQIKTFIQLTFYLFIVLEYYNNFKQNIENIKLAIPVSN